MLSGERGFFGPTWGPNFPENGGQQLDHLRRGRIVRLLLAHPIRCMRPLSRENANTKEKFIITTNRRTIKVLKGKALDHDNEEDVQWIKPVKSGW